MSHPAQDHGAFGPLHDDALDYNRAEVIAAGVQLRAEGQGADRAGIRCLRAGHVLAGVFAADEYERVGRELATLNAQGWDIYQQAQPVSAPITHRLEPGNLGTVRSDGIRGYATLIADIDPEAGSDPSTPLTLARDLREVLIDIGVPRRAIMLMQSGRGAYLEIAIELQPRSARETMRLATQTKARMIAAALLPAKGDQGVFDLARILRVAGTINHKPDADPTTPAWVREPWTPGVRCPWSVVEKIASKSRPKLRAVPTGRGKTSAESASVSRRPLRDLFADRGWLYRERADGIADVRCPNADQHTDGRDGAILYPPREPGGPGWLKCSHAHCADMTLFDVFRLLEGRA